MGLVAFCANTNRFKRVYFFMALARSLAFPSAFFPSCRRTPSIIAFMIVLYRRVLRNSP